MAETLGSLIDKLTIKSIREFYVKGMALARSASRDAKIKEKLAILARQKKALLEEIERFIAEAASKKTALRDDKLKLYNNPSLVNRIGKIKSLSHAIDKLARKNLQLWQLEDQARRTDVKLSFIGAVKKKIDAANQQRNDLIDKIDELLEKKLRKK
jgi:hypothetical protein